MVTSNEVRKNLKHGDAWLRVFFIVVFAFVYGVVNWVLAAVVLVQVFWSLITSNTSQRLRAFGASLGEFVRQIVRFMTYNSDDMPFPFADWPEPAKSESAKPESAKPESVRPDPDKPESAKAESAKAESVSPDPAKPESVRPEPVKPEPVEPKPVKSKAAKPKPVKPKPAKPKPNQEE